MKQLQLQARYPKHFKATTDSNHNLEVAPNTLNRNFNPEKPNQVLVADLSYVWTLGWVYLATIMDFYSREAVDKPHKRRVNMEILK